MKIEKPFRRAAAFAAGVVMLCTPTGLQAYAEDTTAAAETSASTEASTGTTDTTTTAGSEEADAETEESEPEWYKAELDEYDDSLSLISYETSPEASADGTVKAKGKNGKNPTPVALNVTGGYVGDIPWFESEPQIDSIPGKFAVVTYGWGHGVGMSQNGANFYAQYSGWTYQDILFHYYPDTYLMDTGTAEEEQITVAGVSGDVLSIVSQIVYNEVGGSMAYEAIKAQAVAVYTYCKYNGNDSSDLRCKPRPPQNVVDACAEVLGQALYYNGDFALTMFSASSGGITANCNEVFWASPPYLRSVSSDYDRAYDPHYGTVTYIDDFQLRNMIQAAYKIKLSDDPERWIQPTYSEETGYVTYVNIDDQMTVKGYDFKLAIGLKSSKFNVYYTPRPDGEPIPDGTSEPKVVDPDYNKTPAIWYANGYPTDIGAVQPTTAPEDTTDPTEEGTTTAPATGYEDPTITWGTDTTYAEDPTGYTETWTETSTDYGYGQDQQQSWTPDPDYSTPSYNTSYGDSSYGGYNSYSWTDDTYYNYTGY